MLAAPLKRTHSDVSTGARKVARLSRTHTYANLADYAQLSSPATPKWLVPEDEPQAFLQRQPTRGAVVLAVSPPARHHPRAARQNPLPANAHPNSLHAYAIRRNKERARIWEHFARVEGRLNPPQPAPPSPTVTLPTVVPAYQQRPALHPAPRQHVTVHATGTPLPVRETRRSSPLAPVVTVREFPVAQAKVASRGKKYIAPSLLRSALHGSIEAARKSAAAMPTAASTAAPEAHHAPTQLAPENAAPRDDWVMIDDF